MISSHIGYVWFLSRTWRLESGTAAIAGPVFSKTQNANLGSRVASVLWRDESQPKSNRSHHLFLYLFLTTNQVPECEYDEPSVSMTVTDQV